MPKDELPSIEGFVEKNNTLPSINDYLEEENSGNLPSLNELIEDNEETLHSLDDIIKENNSYPSVEELLEVDNLPSVEEYKEQIEEQVIIEEENEVEDNSLSWEELLKIINEVRGEIPEIPEIKYYDAELEKLCEIVDQIKTEIPEVKYYDSEVEVICNQIDFIKEEIKGLPEVKYYDDQIHHIENQLSKLPKVRYYDDDIKNIKEQIEKVKEEIAPYSWVETNFSEIEENFSTVTDALETVKEKINLELDSILENVDIKIFENKVLIGETKGSLEEEKEKIWRELERSSQKIWEYHQEFKDDDRKLKKHIKGEYDQLKLSIEEQIKKYNQESIKTDELLLKYFTELREEVSSFPEVKYYDDQIGKVEENLDSIKFDISELYKIIKEIKKSQKQLKEELLDQIESENDKDLVKEQEDPIAKTLGKEEQKFATLDDLSRHYQLFVNRIQQQLSTVGGGGAGFIKDLDDVSFDQTTGNGKLLIYDQTNSKWVGIASTALSSGGGGDLDTTLTLGNTSPLGMSVGVITATSFSGITTSMVIGLSTVASTGSYNDLLDNPTIPTDTGELTNSVGFVTSSIVVGYATEGYVNNLVAISTFSGSYNDLTNAPTELSHFNNDVGFITSYTESSTLDDILLRGNVSNFGASVGILTASSLNVSGNVSIAGTLTYEDVVNVDSIGIITARSGVQVLDGGINAVGIVTATNFDGSAANITGIVTAKRFETNWPSEIDYNFVAGYQSGELIDSGSNFNVLIGYQAGYDISNSDHNIALGYQSLFGGTFNSFSTGNVAIGYRTLYAITIGDYNICIGYNSGDGVTSGNNNVFIGENSASVNTVTGSDNVALGRRSGYSISSGLNNTLLGGYTGYNLTTGDNNTIVGYGAGYNLDGNQNGNVLIGYYSGFSSDLGDYNIALGYQSAYNQESDYGIFIGHQSGYFSNNASQSVVIGYLAGYDLEGDYNIAIGPEAMYSHNGTGAYNIALGFEALYQDGSNSSFNIAIGYQALYGETTTTGTANIGIGIQAGDEITTGNYNVLIGNYAGDSITTGSNNVVIIGGAAEASSVSVPSGTSDTQLLIGSNTEAWIRGNSSYNVGLGTTNPTSKLHVVGDGLVTGISTFNTTSGIGTVTIGFGNTALYVDGDARVTGILTVGKSSVVIDGDNNTITTGNVTINNSTITLGDNVTLSASATGINSAPNVIYVAKDGNDSNNGTSIDNAFLTISAAVGVATSGTIIKVLAGNYLENNPIEVPPFVSIVGDDLKTVTVTPNIANDDLFHVRKGCYIANMTFTNHVYPAAAVGFPTTEIAINVGGGKWESPYIQNCTSNTTTGIGLRIDGNQSEGLKSIVCDSYTQYNQGGVGVALTNNGYAQLVSVFTICCNEGITAYKGGQCSLTNSNTDFGTYGLVADGTSDLQFTGIVTTSASVGTDSVAVAINTSIRPYEGQVLYFDTLYYTVETISVTNGGSGYTSTPSVTIGTPTGPNGSTATAFATLDGDRVSTITVISSGSQYSSAPSVTISAPDSGTTATADASIAPIYYTINSSTPVISGITTITLDENLNNSVGVGTTAYFYQVSRITSSSHTFEYVGTGNDITTATPLRGGVPVQENEVVTRNGGRVVFTSTDQAGNFRIGNDIVINQNNGTISGRAFTRSLFNSMTPFILALS